MSLFDFTFPSPANTANMPFGMSETGSDENTPQDRILVGSDESAHQSSDDIDSAESSDQDSICKKYSCEKGEGVLHKHYDSDEIDDMEPQTYEADPLDKYSASIKLAFKENIDRASDLRIDRYENNHYPQFKDMLLNNILVHGHCETPIHSLHSPELVQAKKHLNADLKESMAFKALVASSDKECFMKYFPALESHFERFEACKSLISETIVRKFPVLLSTGELNPARVSDLAYVIQAISSAELESKTSVWRVAADESRVINLLIRQWKGNSQRGLNIIMTLAKEFEYKYRKTSRLHHINLLDVLDGFSEDATRQIEAWWGYNVLENPQWTAMRILQEFNDDVLRRYLVVHSLTRERRITSVSESEYAQFTKILQDKHCEDDFWDIQTISGPHSRRNFSMAEEIRRARAAARNHHPACHTAQGIPFMDVNGEMYKLFNGSVLSSTKGLFVLSNQAPVTVTDNKDHLVDLESFTDLSLNDTAGKEHRSQGKGKVLVNGHKLTCYWVPTYMSNVVSMGDIRKLPHHIVQDKYVFVKNVENKSATFVGRIKDKKSFDIRFVDTESMMFPGPNVSKAVQIHYGTHKDEEQTRRLCKMLKVPFGPEDAEAIKKCELCLSLAADDACEVD